MKLLFIQLPLLNHGYNYIDGNLEHAPAVMSAYLKKRFGAKVEVETLPFVISNFASNGIIEKYIKNAGADLLAFTCYLWNIERNLTLAAALKDKEAGRKIIFGGPEITPGAWVLRRKRECVDFFFSGEGEWFFDRLLHGEDLLPFTSRVNGNALVIQPESGLLDETAILDPFIEKRLTPMLDGSIFMEMTRGCPYRCSYCFYSKSCTRVRHIPFEYLLEALGRRGRFDLKEIYILAPTFNKTKDLIPRLRRLSRLDHGVRLHTEMRADGIDGKTARLFYSAGFRSLEVGLQTLNEEALRRAGRPRNTKEELRGMLELKKAGMELKIGIIPGLPGDTPGDFIDTVDRLVELGFAENIELYPLMVLPGTVMRDIAVKEKILYLKKPPYYFIKGGNFHFEDMSNIPRYFEAATGYSHALKCLPDLRSDDRGMLVKGLRFDGDHMANWRRAAAYEPETSVFLFHVTLGKRRSLREGLQRLVPTLQGRDELFQLVLESDALFEEESILDLLRNSEEDNILRRLNAFEAWRDGSRVSLFQIFSDREKFATAHRIYTLIEPVFRVTAGTVSFIENFPMGENPCLLVTGRSYPLIKEALAERSYEWEKLMFEQEEDQEEFFLSRKLEYVKWPFSFRFVEWK